MKFQGIVLAGGKSSRFGEDKSLALVEGVPMIQRAVDLLKELHLDPCVITNATRDYSFLKCRIERDLIPGKGPLGGLYTGCCIFKGVSLVVLGCDMPALTPVVLQNLMKSHQGVHQVITYMRNKTQIQPLPGIYETSLLSVIAKKIARGELSMQRFLRGISKIKLLKPNFDSKILLNINEKKDLYQAT